ncbi:VWA domain-containing protein [bacterium]|nr:VWA domain-containing protein [bacterium]
MIADFANPYVLLLGIPVAALFRRVCAKRKMLLALQIAVVALLLLCLAGPRLRLAEKGTDLIVVADRSLSMPPEAAERMKELVGIAGEGRGRGDRLGVVTFGQGAQVQMLPSETDAPAVDAKPTAPHASDLRDALATALSLVPAGRAARFLVLSDGEYTGPSPASAAREASARSIPIDHRLFTRPQENDLAVERIVLPAKVDSGEPFQFSAVVQADRATTAKYVLLRDGKPIAEAARNFTEGSNRIVFRDILAGRGVCEYRLKVNADGDPRPENNTGRGVLEVVAAPALMLVNADGKPDSLSAALTKASIPVKIFAEDAVPMTLDTLQGYRGVILENVPASKIGRPGMIALGNFVESLGGGLLLSGGRRSFANGGYFKSPLDGILPVSMEVRQEHRKVGIALAVVLDRSGSMMAPVGNGLTKMDLANLGTCAALEVLGANDSITVIAVDSAAHIIVGLVECEDMDNIAAAVKKIESMGGGIFVYTGLLAAGKELEKARQITRHIILFSDAADSEEPGDYKKLLDKFKGLNITVSVIGLGTDKDCDAALLRDIATRGSGTVSFTQDPKDLPRMFAHDTLTVTRSTFVEDPTGLKALPSLLLLAKARYPDIPAAGGYNLTYLRPRATKAITTQDEYNAPCLAFWQRGLGRAAAFTPEIDGEFTGNLAAWSRYGDFLITLGRYLLGDAEPDSMTARMRVAAGEGVLTVEIDPDSPPGAMSNPVAVVVPPAAEGQPAAPMTVPLEWVSPTKLQASFPVDRIGTYRAAVRTGPKSVLRTNPVTLPYSPEFAPRPTHTTGKKTLRLLADLTGGRERLNMEDAFASVAGVARASVKDMTLPLLLVLIIVVVAEIAERRLTLFTTLARGVSRGAKTVVDRAAQVSAAVRLPKRRARPKKVKGEAKPQLRPAEPVEQPAPPPPKPAEPPPPKESKGSVDSALRRVRKRRRGK